MHIARSSITRPLSSTATSGSMAQSAPSRPIWILLFVFFIILPALLFFTVRFTLPGDGTEIVFDFGNRHQPGLTVEPLVVHEHAIHPGDRILALDGDSLESWLRAALFLEHSESPPTEESETATLLRGDEQIELEVPLLRYPLDVALTRKWSIFLFAPYLWAMSLFVFVRRHNDAAARLFLLLGTLVFANITVFSLGLQASELRQAWLVRLWLWHCLVVGQVVLAVLLHMSLIFPRRHPLLLRFPSLVFWGYLGVPLVYAAFLLLNWPRATSMTAFFLLLVQGTVVTPVIFFPLVIVMWATNYISCKDVVQRRQVAWILWGIVVGLGAFMAFSLLPTLLGPQRPLGTNFALVGIFLFAIPTTTTIAILREQLFDIILIINRTLVYVPLTGILAGVFATSMSILPKLFTGNSATASQTTVVVTTLILSAVFTPIKNWLQSLVDKGFKEVPDPLKRLHEFDGEINGIARLIDVNQICRRFLDTAVATLQAQSGAIHMVRNQQWIILHRAEGWKNEPVIEVPIICNHVRLGTLQLGERIDEREYTSGEQEALRATADHVAIVVAILQSAGAQPYEQFTLSSYDESAAMHRSRLKVL